MKRIILDTNLWISFLITAKYDKLDTLLVDQKCQILFSQELLQEFITVCRRPKLRKYFKVVALSDLLEVIEEYAEFIDVNSNVNLCRDPKDNFLLSLGIDGNADCLITGDKDLLVLEKVGSMKICTMTEFLKQTES
jgi:putative PIN family toxin of toxin-antitoxin system